MLNYDYIILLFFIYSFIGYLCEVVYCSVGQRRLVNRGFLYGPYLPIYGSGAMVVLFTVGRFSEHWYLVFLGGVVLTSAIEYFSSWAMEKLFDLKLWDYSTYPLNINGRVCALNSTLFGIMSLVVVYLVNPVVLDFIKKIPEGLQRYLTEFILVILAVDTTLSCVKYIDFKKALRKAREKAQEREQKLQELIASSPATEIVEEFKARMAQEKTERIAEYSKKYRSIFRQNPTLKAKKSDVQLQLLNLKLALEEKKSEIKEKIKK